MAHVHRWTKVDPSRDRRSAGQLGPLAEGQTATQGNPPRTGTYQITTTSSWKGLTLGEKSVYVFPCMALGCLRLPLPV